MGEGAGSREGLRLLASAPHNAAIAPAPRYTQVGCRRCWHACPMLSLLLALRSPSWRLADCALAAARQPQPRPTAPAPAPGHIPAPAPAPPLPLPRCRALSSSLAALLKLEVGFGDVLHVWAVHDPHHPQHPPVVVQQRQRRRLQRNILLGAAGAAGAAPRRRVGRVEGSPTPWLALAPAVPASTLPCPALPSRLVGLRSSRTALSSRRDTQDPQL